MPTQMASSVFQGSCPTRPGSRYASTSVANRTGTRGSVVIAFTLARSTARHPKEKRQPKLPFAERATQHAYAEACLAGFAAVFFLVYFWRNFSTRPAVSTIFCLPV